MNWNSIVAFLRCSVADWFLSALEGSDKVKHDGHTHMASLLSGIHLYLRILNICMMFLILN